MSHDRTAPGALSTHHPVAWHGMRGIAPVPSYVIMQPTTLCNLDCAYCYLPFRADGPQDAGGRGDGGGRHGQSMGGPDRAILGGVARG